MTDARILVLITLGALPFGLLFGAAFGGWPGAIGGALGVLISGALSWRWS